MHRRAFATAAVLLLLGSRPLVAQAGTGNWSARSNSGLMLMGGYTVVPDSVTGAVTGTWTLTDPQGKPLAQGGWSAAKAANAWRGAWRSVVTGTGRQYAGTFTADVRLSPSATLRDMFAAAVKDVVSGTWQTGAYAGSWSVRAAP